MIVRLLLLCLLSFNLYGTSNAELLKRADTALKSGKKSTVFTAYNSYKNLYLKALIDGDVALQKKALRGIVASGDKLHIDVSEYQKKLAKHPKNVVKHHSSKPQVKRTVHPTAVTKPTIKPEHTKKKIKIIYTHSITKAQWKGNELIITFSKNLVKNRVNFFKLEDAKKKSYRYIFDIHTSLLGKNYKLRKSSLKRVSLSQYKRNTARLVIESSRKLPLRFWYKQNQLVIRPGIAGSIHQNVSLKKEPPIAKKTIVIDPGHGGKDSGAIGYKRNIYEKEIVFKISKELAKALKRKGHNVYLTRTRDTFIKLPKRTEYANKKRADIFISIHANAIPKSGKIHQAYGIETYFLSPANSKRAARVAAKENIKDMDNMNRFGKESFLNFLNREKILASNKLAIDIQQGMLGTLRSHYSNIKDMGVRKGPFWVLVGAQMPAVLVEVGFVSNPKEAKRLISSTYQKRLAQGLAEGIERYFAKNP